MKPWHPLALAAFVATAPLTLDAQSADDGCGLVSADPACPHAARPKLTVSFQSTPEPPAPAVRPQRAPTMRLQVPAEAPGYCRMPIVEPDRTVHWAMRLVRPRDDVHYTMKVVTVPPCPPTPRRAR